jgi:hypothetical protein
MAIIPYFKDPTTGLVSLQLSHYLSSQDRRPHSEQTNPSPPSSFSFSFSSFSLPCTPKMASSSRRSVRNRRETSFGEGDPPIPGEAATPRGGEDHYSSSSSDLEPTGSVEDVLGRPMVQE